MRKEQLTFSSGYIAYELVQARSLCIWLTNNYYYYLILILFLNNIVEWIDIAQGLKQWDKDESEMAIVQNIFTNKGIM